MKIPNEFKQIIGNTFYDKDIQIWQEGTKKDDEGSIITSGVLEMIDEVTANFQFKTKEYIQQEYGKEIQANAIVTCDKTVAKIGDIIVYDGNNYVIKSKIMSDSHTTLLVNGSDKDV